MPPRPTIVSSAVTPIARAAARLGVQLGPDGGDLRSLLKGTPALAEAGPAGQA